MGFFDRVGQFFGNLPKDQLKDINYTNDKTMLMDVGLDARNVVNAAPHGPAAIDDALAKFHTNLNDATQKINNDKMKSALDHFRKTTENVARDAKNTQWLHDPRTGYATSTPDPHSTFGASQHRVETGLAALMDQMNQHMNPNKNQHNAQEFKPNGQRMNDSYANPGERFHGEPGPTNGQWFDDGTYRSH